MKKILGLLLVSISLSLAAQERVAVWPKGKMPDAQAHQIAAMTDESERPEFNPDKHRVAYLEWFEKPANPTGACMILISGGSYMNCCDVGLIDQWHKRFTELGVQCVNFVYRTPRPVGLPIYQTAWEDGQRAVRLVRKEAAKRGFDPEKIGVISMSAGSHLALLLATSSQTPAYERIDKTDDIPCHINWAIVNAPAYVTTDGETGTPALRDGYGADVKISDAFKFDEKTCPMSLHHGGQDPYSPNGSTLVYRQLRRMGIPAELHLYPGKGHGAFGFERGIEFMTQMGYLGPLGEPEKLMDRFAADVPGVTMTSEDIWPEGKMPDPQPDQCKPYIEWHIPAVLKTTAIQIIYAGGAYNFNRPEDFEVAPARKYLNEKGMAVVVIHPGTLAANYSLAGGNCLTQGHRPSQWLPFTWAQSPGLSSKIQHKCIRAKQKQTLRHRKQICGYARGERTEGQFKGMELTDTNCRERIRIYSMAQGITVIIW